MGDWRHNDDLDLTAGDLSAMLEAGEAVELVNAPHLPAGARLITPNLTYGAVSTQRPTTSFAVGAAVVSQQLVG